MKEEKMRNVDQKQLEANQVDGWGQKMGYRTSKYQQQEGKKQMGSGMRKGRKAIEMILWIVVILSKICQSEGNNCYCNGNPVIYTSTSGANESSCPSCGGHQSCQLKLKQTIQVTTNSSQNIFHCQPCQLNCQVCASPTTCQTCIPTFYESGGNCLNCSNSSPHTIGCNSCNSTICFGCSNQFYYTQGVCISCSTPHGGPGCWICDSSVCSHCSPTYGQDQSQLTTFKCITCSLILQCLDCSAGPVCTKCNNGFAIRDNDTSIKKQCIQCSTDIPNCFECANGIQCIKCESHYCTNQTTCIFDLIQANKQCVHASTVTSNCDTCNNGPVCTGCIDGYALHTSNRNLFLYKVSKPCIACNLLFKCLNCTDGPKCTQCQPGFFLDSTSSMCFPCQFPCFTCSVTSINCTNCDSSQLFYRDLNGETCKLCHQQLDFCLKCNINGDICYKCNSTFQFVNDFNQCQDCLQPCSECLSINKCIACDNDTFALDEGPDPGSVICKACSELITNCISCLKPDVCTQCDPDYFTTYPPMKCWTCVQAIPNCKQCIQSAAGPFCTVCNDKFYPKNGSCFDCRLSCTTCQGFDSCLTCITPVYALSNGICVFCDQVIPNCAQCSSNQTCTKCTYPFIPNLGICAQCPTLKYPNEINQTCDPCIPPCESCISKDLCLTCVQFYQAFPAINQCKDLCGDSIVIENPCDNGPGVFHDGCSDQCQPEPNYTCVNNSDIVSGQPVKRSVCSYNLPLNISLFSIEKEPFKNTMTFNYLVVPFLFGLPGTTSRVFTQEELKQAFVLHENNTRRLLTPSPSPCITVESVLTDPSNSKVSVTFSYDHSIRESNMELYIDFQFLKTSLGLQNFATTPDTAHSLQVSSFQPQSMIGQFHSEDEYSQAILLDKLATVIGIMSFLAFLIGIFTKEVVGLEMAMLCQFTYLSLFFFKSPLELSFFALKGLIYSTGYNLPLADLNFQVLDQNPPQSFTLGFDPRTFSSNFNLMTILYILPLVLVIPFVPLKAKCIRKISMIELGHKWVDLLMGEIMLFCVLFNFQYLLFGMIAFYRDGRDVTNYASSMMIWLGMLCTVCSFLGLIFKPQIYGNFRTCFKYDSELRREVLAEREKNQECEEHLTKKFKEKSICEGFKNLILSFKLFVNENYFWKNHRKIHTLLTYSHYNFFVFYFCLITLVINLAPRSEIVLMVLSGILLIDLILMRPYYHVSEKLRGIYFALVYIGVSVIRYLCSDGVDGEFTAFLSSIILLILGLALIWTYLSLVMYFWGFFGQNMNDRDQIVAKVFEQNDEYKIAKEEDTIMRNLMKRYERVELQYNVENARDTLISGYSNIKNVKKLSINIYQNNTIDEPFFVSDQNDPNISKGNVINEILNKAEEQKYFKNLRDDLNKEHRRKKKKEMNKRVGGDEMLKLLKLNNFSKYQKGFTTTDESENMSESRNNEIEKNNQQSQCQQKYQVESEIDESYSSINEKEDYKSVEPQNLQEAENKIAEERVIVDENQYVRYKRAIQLLSNEGLTVDKRLIAQRYDHI